MIKYFVIEDRKQVIALLEGTKWDAYNKICKTMRGTDFCVAPNKKYLMPNHFKVVVSCDSRDSFDPEFGKKRAKKILLDNYYKSLHKRLDRFNDAALILNGKVFENPDVQA